MAKRSTLLDNYDGLKPVKNNPGNDSSYSSACELWKSFLSLLSQNIKEAELKTWFNVLKPKNYNDSTLTVSVPSKEFYEMIENRFNKQITKVLESGIFGENGKLKYEISQHGLFDGDDALENNPVSDSDSGFSKNQNYYRPDFQNKFGPEIKNPAPNEKTGSNLYNHLVFSNLVKGESNEFAVTAAYAVTNNPGRTFNNPFYVYGGVGVGKTHLIQAIGNEILRKYPDKKVYYTTAPEFTTQFTTNMAQSKIEFSSVKDGVKKLDSFYKSLDVLIIDDIQNFAGKPSTQDFIYQIFNYLHNNKKHLIFSSDKPLNQLKDIEERLISRFHWGLTVDIQPPNWEMRVAIIQKKLERAESSAPEDVIHYIATNVKDSIRTIEGCIAGMIMESVIVSKSEITFDMAERVVKRVIGDAGRAKNISIENIIHTVSVYYNISENSIRSKRRTKEIAFARQAAMYLSKELTNFTLESIGLNFGGKDHATVLYACNTIKDLLKKDKQIQNQIEEIKQKLAPL